MVDSEVNAGRRDMGRALLTKALSTGLAARMTGEQARRAIDRLLSVGTGSDEALLPLVEKLSDEEAFAVPLGAVRCSGARKAEALVIRKGFKASVGRHLCGELEIANFGEWLSLRDGIERLTRSEISALISNVLRAAERRPSAATWGTLPVIAPVMLRSDPQSVPDSIRRAFDVTRLKIDGGGAVAWSDIVALAEQHVRSLRLETCSLSVRLAMLEPNRPLGVVVAASFPTFYESLPSGRRSFRLLDPFGFFDEVDGKKVARRELVDRFLASRWAPAELAVAAKGAGIVHKVVGRLVRLGRRDYIQAMFRGLNERGDRTLAQEVNSAFKSAIA